jgi:hypothetical protein
VLVRQHWVRDGWVLGSTALLTLAWFAACGGGGGSGSSGAERTAQGRATTTSGAPSPTTSTPKDVDMTAADFPNINTLTKVHDHFVGNLRGHLPAALAVANSAKGGVYPVGTIIQLIPTEVMVKRRPGWNAATHDWEFFSLDVSPTGTKIISRGATDVRNRFGLDCLSCHAKAAPQFDMVCEKDHGCDPLPLSDQVIAQLQQADPRPK